MICFHLTLILPEAEIGVQCHTAKTYSTFRSRVVIMKLETFAAELVDAGCSLPPHKINTPKDPEPRCYNSCVRRLYVYGGSSECIINNTRLPGKSEISMSSYVS